MPSLRHPTRALPRLFALLSLLVLGAAPGEAAPFLWPATPGGQPTWRDERDTAPYLAAWKAAGLARERKMMKPATANQLAYDVTFYDLDLTPVPTALTLNGVVRTRAVVTNGPLTTIDLDFASFMTVDGATSAGNAATFSRAGDVLTVNLDRTYANGEMMDVTVSYHGNPTPGGSFGFNTVSGQRLVWSLSEPFGARTWWPCKDDNADKADSVDIKVTVPTGMKTASNGTRIENTDNGTNAVTRWRERYPIATYLVAIASYPYATSTDWYRPTPTDSMIIQFFNFPSSVPTATPVQAKVKDMLAAYAPRFGLYPFFNEKYGHAEFLFGGGMEHQTCTYLGVYDESVVAHELGHQWWGDKVTCNSFNHIWLNEGFATYAEAVWAEANGGASAYHADIDINAYFGGGTVYVPDLSDPNRIFDSNTTYNKGSWVLHMLRHVLGDATFFQALQTYGTQYAYSTATTEQFRDVCEAVSGRDLDKFFDQWIYGEYYPAYRMTSQTAAGGGGYDVTVTLEQTQSWQLFRMPVDLRITTGSGTQTFVLEDSLASQQFVVHVADAPQSIALDPDNWILKTLDAPVTAPTFEKGVLVVNGVDWNTYGTEITTAYSDRIFWNNYPIDFWDHFQAPSGGYPGTLPAPIGHGAVPPDVMGRYRCVVWVGNNFNGDILSWLNSPAFSYLKAGGNLLLLTRMGNQFLGDSLTDYLGINYTNTNATLTTATATRPGFSNISTLGSQTFGVTFDTTRTRTDTQLIYRSGASSLNGIGVIRMPTNGGTFRLNGGRFAFLSGRPYRWNHTTLRNTVTTILGTYFLEPLNPLAVDGPSLPARLELAPPRPNPFAVSTLFRFTLPRAGEATIDVLDASGRRVRTLELGRLAAGAHEATWDGRGQRGHRLPVGVYWTRVTVGTEAVSRKVVLAR